MAAASLRDQQIASIKRILNLNSPIPDESLDDPSHEVTDTSPEKPLFKVLVLDSFGRDVLSTVMRVADLRKMGVTLHLLINTKRHPVSDTPVVYLVEPTIANIDHITQDLSSGLYSPAYVNFLSPISRDVLEQFGEKTISSGTSEHLAQVYDQYLTFIAESPQLFHLNMPGTFHTLSSSQSDDHAIESCMNKIVERLFAVVATMGTIPIIRCSPKGPAEEISAKLDRRLRDHVLNAKANVFSDNKSATIASRPVLIIVDRNLDLVPMFGHSWIYQNMVKDVLNFHLNKVEISVPVDKNNPVAGVKKQTHDITASDYLWEKTASLPFPEAADVVTQEWQKYQNDANAVTKTTGLTSIDDADENQTQFASHLKSAMALLPELKLRRATIELHMSILEAVMEGIKERKLDVYFQTEEELHKLSQASVLEMIQSELGREPLDKLRLFLQWYLTTEHELSRGEIERFTEALKAAGAETAPINYIKTVRQLTRFSMLQAAPAQPAKSSTQLFGGLSGGLSGLSSRLKEANFGANLDGVLSGIKNYLPTDNDGTLTKIVESICDPHNASASAISKTESYLYFDPRSSQSRSQNKATRGSEATFGQRRQGFSEAIVFPVGGGSMDEYGNLQAWAKRTNGAAGTGQKRRIIYGSTALLNSRDFINDELVPLGKESS